MSAEAHDDDEIARRRVEYRENWEAQKRLRTRPDVMAKVRARIAVLDAKYGYSDAAERQDGTPGVAG